MLCSANAFAEEGVELLLSQLYFHKGQQNINQVGAILRKLNKVDQNRVEVVEENIVYLIVTEQYEQARTDLFKAKPLLPQTTYEQLNHLLEIYQFNNQKLAETRLLVKRKLYESQDFVIKRIQQFRPPSGKTSINRATKSLQNFLDNCFTKEGYNQKEMPEIINNNCKWCPYYKTHLCSATFK